MLAAWNRLLTVFGKNAAAAATAAYSLSLHPHTALHYCTMVKKLPEWSDPTEFLPNCSYFKVANSSLTVFGKERCCCLQPQITASHCTALLHNGQKNAKIV